jgi:hypothetical protein
MQRLDAVPLRLRVVERTERRMNLHELKRDLFRGFSNLGDSGFSGQWGRFKRGWKMPPAAAGFGGRRRKHPFVRAVRCTNLCCYLE